MGVGVGDIAEGDRISVVVWVLRGLGALGSGEKKGFRHAGFAQHGGQVANYCCLSNYIFVGVYC